MNLLKLHYQTLITSKLDWTSFYFRSLFFGSIFRALDLDFRGKIRKYVPLDARNRYITQCFEESISHYYSDSSRIIQVLDRENILEYISSKPAVLATFHYGAYCYSLTYFSRIRPVCPIISSPKNYNLSFFRDYLEFKYLMLHKEIHPSYYIDYNKSLFEARKALDSGYCIAYTADLPTKKHIKFDTHYGKIKIASSLIQLASRLGYETFFYMSHLSRKGVVIEISSLENAEKLVSKYLELDPGNWIASDLLPTLIEN